MFLRWPSQLKTDINSENPLTLLNFAGKSKEIDLKRDRMNLEISSTDEGLNQNNGLNEELSSNTVERSKEISSNSNGFTEDLNSNVVGVKVESPNLGGLRHNVLDLYLSSSPPPFCPEGREVDIEVNKFYS